MAMRKLAAAYSIGILATAAVMTGSQATAGSGPDRVLAVGHHGQPVTAMVRFADWSAGPTEPLLVVGVPGSTAELADATHLTRSAVLLAGNQVTSELMVDSSSLGVRFSASHSGVYPVFLFALREPPCHSVMMDTVPAPSTITQVGVVRIT